MLVPVPKGRQQRRMSLDMGEGLETPCALSATEANNGPHTPSIIETSSSSKSEWRGEWHDFAGHESSLDYSDSDLPSESSSIAMHHKIGYYERNRDLDNLDFCARYHDRFWQSPETTLLGDRESFRGPQPGPKARVTQTKPSASHFFHLF